jgi:hypothetical protein
MFLVGKELAEQISIVGEFSSRKLVQKLKLKIILIRK